MAYSEKRGKASAPYYIARYKDPATGKYPTVRDDDGRTLRYKTKREADKAGEAAETKAEEAAKAAKKKRRDPAAGTITFTEFVNVQYATYDLAITTMDNYRRRIENHLLPAFGDKPLDEIEASDIEKWEREKLRAGYAKSTVGSWRRVLHTLLADAVKTERIDVNPATREPNRGKRAGRSRARGPEKVITTPLGALLIAERCALLSGRDDEFVMVVTTYYTGMRWAEITGLERENFRLSTIYVGWQYVEVNGQFHRCPPKDDSYREIDIPRFLSDLISGHLTRTAPKACGCHGQVTVFRGRGPERTAAGMADVAKRAGVSVGTVSNVLNHPERVKAGTRERVEAAAAALGWTPGGTGTSRPGEHWRRSGFADSVFGPAVSGQRPTENGLPQRPVALAADPWPGTVLRGRGALDRAEVCWMPIAPDLTPHGLRHSHKTRMNKLWIDDRLQDERLGHLDGSIQARYSHVLDEMRGKLITGLTAEWYEALDARLAMNPRSPVAVLDELLKARRKQKIRGRSEDRPTDFPQEGVPSLRLVPEKGL